MYPLPDLDAIPADAAAEALLAVAPSAPTAVPDWLLADRAPMTVLDAVMRHPAPEITAALQACTTSGDLFRDLQTLLEHLAGPEHLRGGARG